VRIRHSGFGRVAEANVLRHVEGFAVEGTDFPPPA
jgi:hypothetical protein